MVVPREFTATTDATTAIQGVIDRCQSVYGGGTVRLPPGTFNVQNLLMRSKVHVVGAGIGATTLKLVASSTGDVVRAPSFDTLTGGSAQSGINQWSLRDLTLDGNKANAASGGWCLRVYASRFVLTDLDVRSGKAGGLWTEWGTGGVEMESHLSRVHIGLCDGPGWDFRGPHDTQYNDVIIWKCVDGFHSNGNGNGLWGTNMHVWGDESQPYGFVIRTQGNRMTNSYSDGSGILIDEDRNWWDGYIINPGGATGLTAISMGPTNSADRCFVKAHIRDFENAFVGGTESENIIDLFVDGAGPGGFVTSGPHHTDTFRLQFGGQTSTDGEQTKVPGFIGLDQLAGDPIAPVNTTEGRMYLRDNGSGKNQLVIRFDSGAVQVIATEP